jgi:hypothetical protein
MGSVVIGLTPGTGFKCYRARQIGEKKMRKLNILTFMMAAVVIVTIVVLGNIGSKAQELAKRETYQAQAMGTSTQIGRTFNVTVIIDEYSTPEERQALIEAFTSKGSQGLFNALNKVHSKGRIAMTGTLGYDISYVRSIPSANGQKIRLVTNRPITFGEAWSDSRSMDYNLSAMEMDLTTDDKGKMKGTGTLIPACQFKIDKDKELQIEAYQNPWKLVDVMQR